MQLGQGMHDYDKALVAFLNGDGGPELLRRLSATVAERRMLDAGELAELNELLARTPVTARLVDGGEGRYALDMRAVADDPTASSPARSRPPAPRARPAQAVRRVRAVSPRLDP